MSPRRKGPYATLSGQSDASLPLHAMRTDESEDSDALDRKERSSFRTGHSTSDDDDHEADETEIDEGGEARGMLTGVSKRESLSAGDEVAVFPNVGDKAWLSRVSFRSVLLALLGVLVLLGVLLLFHPSSPARSIVQYYHGATKNGQVMSPGTWRDGATLADNPLPTDAKFGDIPFAKAGGSWAGPEPGLKGKENLRSNGTHEFERTVILVSLDGVRADYLERGLTPHLLSLSKKGFRAKYLQSVFPSLTFPNHWSLMTGLYPASHGIVGNDFVDPVMDEEFVYTVPEKSWPSKWWGGEPLWETAIKNGLRSAVLMWPGPPVMASGARPTYWYAFQDHYSYQRKLDRISGWLDMPSSKRPHFIAAYIPEVDQEGHRTGPHSHAVENTLLNVDSFAKSLWDVLEARNLTGIVDVLFVADHGMSDTSNERLVYLDDILGEEGFHGIKSQEGWPSAGLRFNDHINTTDMLNRLSKAAEASSDGFHVYTPETMPKQWNFAGHERIPDIYVVPHVGWAITNRKEFHQDMKGDFSPKGIHGYDPAEPSMQAICVAHGPFADSLKLTASDLSAPSPKMEDETLVLPGFANLEIYNLVTDLLGIEPGKRAPNNGTEGFWGKVF